jgi:type VI secretion system protein VasD
MLRLKYLLNRYYLITVLILVLNACLLMKSTHVINVHLQAARYLNPDIKGEASPIEVTLYELRNNTLFDKVDFFKLQDNSLEALNGSLIDQRSLTIRPKERIRFKYHLSPKTRYLGIVAGYRHLAFSEWKKLVDLKEKSIKHINILLGASSFSIDKS